MKNLTEWEPIELIRVLSGMFEVKEAINRLALVNLISRYILDEADYEFVTEVLKTSGIKMKRIRP